MSSPAFYLYPSESGPLRRVTLDRSISRFDVVPMPQREDIYTLDQRVKRAFFGMRYSVFIGVEGYVGGEQDLERKVSSIETHLAAGGTVGFSYDHAKTWAAQCTNIPAPNDTVVHHGGGNAFTAWSNAGTLANSDPVVLEGDYASLNPRQNTLASTFASHQTILSDVVIHSYRTAPILRYRWFLPTLFQPQNASSALVTTDYRLNYRFGFHLEYLPSAAFALFGSGGYQSSAVGGKLPLRGETVVQGNSGLYSTEQRINSYSARLGRT